MMPRDVARAFRFGILSTGGSLEEWRTTVCKAEDLGFSTVVVQDHFGRQLSPLMALTYAAAITSRIRLGTIVLDNDFRHPASVAKEAATLDVLSSGRLELGLGAGWQQADYDKTGLTFDPPATRLERLTEAVHICKAFFSQDAVTLKGRHYQIQDLDGFPKPVQQPRPPIMIGGRQRRMLSFAAREADIVGISLLDRGAFADKVAWVREAAGPRFPDEIELHVNVSHLEITDNPRAALERVAERRQVQPDDLLQAPGTLVGSVDSIVEQLHSWRERFGVSYFVANAQFIDAFAPVVAGLSGL
jgi:probable F420-dependent oxidoreductase